MGTQTSEEIHEEYLTYFGAKDAQIVQILTDRVSSLALQWRIFLYLFCGPKERVDVLNRSSRLTAMFLKDLLWDNTLLRVRQLTDPVGKGKNLNLSLEQLRVIAKDVANIDLSNSLELVLETCRPSRDYATKYLAHTDLDHALGTKRVEVLRRDTTLAVNSIGNLVREFHARVRNVDYAISPITSANDEKQFLLRLHQGNEAAETREAVLLEGARAGSAEDLAFRIPSWIWEQASGE